MIINIDLEKFESAFKAQLNSDNYFTAYGQQIIHQAIEKAMEAAMLDPFETGALKALMLGSLDGRDGRGAIDIVISK